MQLGTAFHFFQKIFIVNYLYKKWKKFRRLFLLEKHVTFS